MDYSRHEEEERGITKDNSEVKYHNSEAENKFYNYIRKRRPDLRVTKKGLPDFMIIKNGKAVGFIEVKRTEAYDGLREEQNMFRLFCKENNIPYQVWSPNMAGKRWGKASEHFKKAWAYGEEIWNKI